ncbi:MAG: diguanylate cyclase domain-containing protein, partial [Nocardioidaceae bacterium]
MDDQHAHHDCDRCERLERRYQREHRARLESESIAEKFSREALHDPLTGLGNRTMFLGQLDTALERAHRTRTYLGLLFLDLDDFKLVNDTLGHAAGDQLLAAIGHRIAGCVRAGDVAARLGGDEFVVLVENVLDGGALEEVAERIRAKLLEPCRVGGQDWRTRVSIGIRLADGSDDVAAVLRDADAAMYAAKD